MKKAEYLELDLKRKIKHVNKMEQLVLGREATEKETQIINQAQALLDQVGLKLIGTRPKDR